MYWYEVFFLNSLFRVLYCTLLTLHVRDFVRDYRYHNGHFFLKNKQPTKNKSRRRGVKSLEVFDEFIFNFVGKLRGNKLVPPVRKNTTHVNNANEGEGSDTATTTCVIVSKSLSPPHSKEQSQSTVKNHATTTATNDHTINC